jgi:hypothetical protein
MAEKDIYLISISAQEVYHSSWFNIQRHWRR